MGTSQPELVHDQLYSLLETYPINFVKCGMLPTEAIIEEVIAAKQQYNFQLIVDPIIVSGSGMQLVEDSVLEMYKTQLIPIADVVTPNAPKAQYLTGLEITNIDSIREIGE